MNWGQKLIGVFIVFAALMSTLVYMCTKQNFELVSKDYYSEELRYQDKIDGMNNVSKLAEEVLVRQNYENVVIELPKEMHGMAISGEAFFYCADDSKKDRKIDLVNDSEGKQFISKTKLARANYVVKVNWKSGNDLYYTEKSIVVQ